MDINSQNGFDLYSTPLSIASQRGHYATVKYLLEHGAKSHIDYLNLKKKTPLYYAAENGQTSVVNLLLNFGKANTEIQNTEKLWTALHVASYLGHTEIAKLLLFGKSYPFQTTGDGKDTPLSLAEKNGHHSVAILIRLIYNATAEDAEKKGKKLVALLLKAVSRIPPYSLEQIFPGSQNVTHNGADIWKKLAEQFSSRT